MWLALEGAALFDLRLDLQTTDYSGLDLLAYLRGTAYQGFLRLVALQWIEWHWSGLQTLI